MKAEGTCSLASKLKKYFKIFNTQLIQNIVCSKQNSIEVSSDINGNNNFQSITNCFRFITRSLRSTLLDNQLPPNLCFSISAQFTPAHSLKICIQSIHANSKISLELIESAPLGYYAWALRKGYVAAACVIDRTQMIRLGLFQIGPPVDLFRL